MEGCKGVMSLDKYTAKRRFEKTPEPPPSASKSTPTAKPSFCVQRHDATRLHYDFRLEIDGVLKSWAVPKGPSLDPAVKVFAAHVEDHPLEYGDFEGNIPAGNYGGGSVMLWDRGTFDLLGDVAGEAQLARGDLKSRLHGEKLKGDFAIVLMKARAKGNEWLLIKKRDEFAAAGWDVEALAYSVLSGRTQEEIARNLPARQTKRQTAGVADRVWATSPPAGRARATVRRSAREEPPADVAQAGVGMSADGRLVPAFLTFGRCSVASASARAAANLCNGSAGGRARCGWASLASYWQRYLAARGIGSVIKPCSAFV